MKNGVVPIVVQGVIPTNRGCAVFVGNDDKVFTIYVEATVGHAILMFMHDKAKERPLTHDMIGYIFVGLGVRVQRVVINDLKEGTYYARLVLEQKNELGEKVIEIDARPSDCLALAVHAKAPVYVTQKVFDEVEDMTEVLKKLNAVQGELIQEEESEDDDETPGSFHPNVDEPGPDEEPPSTDDKR